MTHQAKKRKIYKTRANEFTNYRDKSKTLATKMKTTYSLRKFRDVATKPTKHKQTNESLTTPFSPGTINPYIVQELAGTQAPHLRVKRQPH